MRRVRLPCPARRLASQQQSELAVVRQQLATLKAATLGTPPTARGTTAQPATQQHMPDYLPSPSPSPPPAAQPQGSTRSRAAAAVATPPPAAAAATPPPPLPQHQHAHETPTRTVAAAAGTPAAAGLPAASPPVAPPTGGSAGGSGGGGQGGLAAEAEVQRLLRRRAELLATGAYAQDDALIQRIEAKVAELGGGMAA